MYRPVRSAVESRARIFFTIAASLALTVLTSLPGRDAYGGLLDDIGSPVVCEMANGSEDMAVFARKCRDATGIDIPAFDCDSDDFTPVPEPHLTADPYPNAKCDYPNVLNHVCDPGSRFHVLVQTPEATAVAHCRKKGGGNGEYGDIAVIQYNRVNGATCFYQALRNYLPSKAPAPSGGTGGFWKTPLGAAGDRCVSCHDTGPFIRSPYLAQLRTQTVNRLPGTRFGAGTWDQRFSWNQTLPYKFVGANFQSWKVYSIMPSSKGAECTMCHRMGLSSLEGKLELSSGTSLALGPIATAREQDHKHAHSMDSPIWMKPGQTDYVEAVEAQALDVQRCALAIANYGNGTAGPPPPECRWALYGQGDTCKGPGKVPVNWPPGVPSPGPTGGEIPLPGCPPGRTDCPVVLYYWVALHGPFWQRSDGSVRFDDPRYAGSYARFFVDGNAWKAKFYSNPDGGPPQVAPGGVLEYITVSEVAGLPDPTACFGSPFSLVERDGSVLDDRIETTITPDPMNVISGLIGNVAQANADPSDRVRITDAAGRFFLEQRHTIPPPPPHVPGAMTAESWGYGCNAWKPNIVAKDVFTESDVQLVPAANSKDVRCFITGISGAWSSTRDGGATVPSAEIYTTPAREIRLRVKPARPEADRVGAWATCIRS